MLGHAQTRWFAYLLVLAVGAALFLPNLGSHGLWEVDEAHNAQCAREMLDAGTWRVPTFNFQLRTDKPALLYWLIGIAYRLFGLTEFAARFFSAVAGVLTLLATYELGRRMFTPITGLLAACVLGSSLMFCVAAHAATPDAQLILWTTLSLLVFWIGFTADNRNWLLAFGVTAALAVLAKGPIGWALPAAVITLFLWWEGKLASLWCKRFLLGTLLFFAVAGPWYAIVTSETRGEWAYGFFLKHNFDRFGVAMEGHGGPIFYHLLVLPAAFAPWSAFLPAALWYATRRRAEISDAAPSPRLPVPYRFLWCWVGVWLVFFSLAGTKLPNYLLPAYPALAILVARFLCRWAAGEARPARGWIVWSLLCLALVGAVSGGGIALAAGWLPVSLPRSSEIPELGPLALVSLLPLAAVGWLMWQRRNPRLAVAGLTTGCVVFVALLAAFGPAALAPHQVAPALAARLNAEEADEVRLAAWGCYYPAVVFYTNREMRRLGSVTEASDWLAAPQRGYLIVPAAEWERIAEPLRKSCVILDRRRDVLLNRDVLLVANQRPGEPPGLSRRKVWKARTAGINPAARNITHSPDSPSRDRFPALSSPP
jgi:4-amino-4-deoxy-L-arabinose transferase-like glycosyltransferase